MSNRVVVFVCSSPPAANGHTLVTEFNNWDQAEAFAMTLRYPSIVSAESGNAILRRQWVPSMLDRFEGMTLAEAAHDMADWCFVANGIDTDRVSDHAYADAYDETESDIMSMYESVGYECDMWDGNMVLPDASAVTA